MQERLAGRLVANPADHPNQDGAFEGSSPPSDAELEQIGSIIAETGLQLVDGADDVSLFHHLAASKTVYETYQRFRQVAAINRDVVRLNEIAKAASVLRGKLMLAKQEGALVIIKQAFPKPVRRGLNHEYGGPLGLQPTTVTAGTGPVVNEAEPSLQAMLNGLEMLTSLPLLVTTNAEHAAVRGDAAFAASPQEVFTVDIMGQVYASHFGKKPTRSINKEGEAGGPFVRFVRASSSYLGIDAPEAGSISRHMSLTTSRRRPRP
jgi:hypothetical protein